MHILAAAGQRVAAAFGTEERSKRMRHYCCAFENSPDKLE